MAFLCSNYTVDSTGSARNLIQVVRLIMLCLLTIVTVAYFLPLLQMMLDCDL